MKFVVSTTVQWLDIDQNVTCIIKSDAQYSIMLIIALKIVTQLQIKLNGKFHDDLTILHTIFFNMTENNFHQTLKLSQFAKC